MLVNQKAFDLLVEPHVPRPDDAFGKRAYGYGWGITPNFFGSKLVAHSGSVGIYTASLGYLPDRKVGVSALANSGGLDSDIALYALSLLTGHDPRTLPFVKTNRILSRLEGQYEAYNGTVGIAVRKRGGILYIEYKNKYEEQIIPLTPEKLEEDRATFYVIAAGVKTTFEFEVRDDKIELLDERKKFVKKG